MRTRKKRKIGRNLEKKKICKRYKERENREDKKKALKEEKTAKKEEKTKTNKKWYIRKIKIRRTIKR